MKVADALSRARDIGVARLDAQLLIAHHLGRSRSWVLAHDDDALLPAHQALVLEDLGRLADGVPLAYIRKEREFHGLSLEVGPAVLVPRPDTEVLVDWALQLLSTRSTPSKAVRVADLGTGSGAIALAVRHACPGAEVWATDLSLEALETARRNATRLKLQVDFRAGCWWAPLQGQRFDLLLSNPPYIASDDPHLAALVHEPREALTPGGDGLSALRTLARGGPDHLVDGGWMLLEHGHEQAADVALMLRQAGFEAIQTRSDLAGRPRCTGGRKPSPPVSR